MSDHNIAFIGAGNMASSLIHGLISHGYNAQQIWAVDPDAEKLASLRGRYAIHTTSNSNEAVSLCGTVVLAVKPQVMQAVCGAISGVMQQHPPLIVSIAAGITTAALQQWLGHTTAVIRAMPNTPAAVGSGATALYATSITTQAQRDRAETVMRSVGIALWVESEAQMDAVTALSGSGPAYFFYLMEALEKAGVDLGLPAETARLLTLQTGFGATKMALESNDSTAVLRHRVTSPGGTTERAINHFEEMRLKTIIENGLIAAHARAQELADSSKGEQ